MIHPRNQCHKCSNRGDGPCPSPFYTLPQIGRNERYKITFSQEHATTKSGCSQSKILSASRHPRVYPRDGKKDLLGSALPPFSLRGGRCEEDAEKASKSHEKTSEDPTTFTSASSEWVLFSLSYEVLFTFFEEPTSLSRGPTVIKRPTEELPPSLPPARRRRPGPRALGGGRHIRRQN